MCQKKKKNVQKSFHLFIKKSCREHFENIIFVKELCIKHYLFLLKTLKIFLLQKKHGILALTIKY